MTAKRKADLQRKLSLASVPKPPAGLAERIKADIPEYLRPEEDRRRLRRSVAFNLRVAASVILVISSVVATIYLLAPEEQMSRMAEIAPRPQAVTGTLAPPTQELKVDIVQDAPAKPVMQVADVAASRRDAPQRAERLGEQEGAAGGSAAGFTSFEEVQVAEAAPPPPAVSAPAAPEVPPAAEPIAVTAEAPLVTEQRAVAKAAAPSASFVREAFAADLAVGRRPSSAFGISLDENAFTRIKTTLENNQRPSAASVNVEAIVNYFAGEPVRRPRRGVKLEVEGSPSPVGGVDRKGFLRFSIDTASNGSTLPIASDARIEIDVNGRAVERATPVGDAGPLGPEAALLEDLSVTGLYEITLRPNLKPAVRVATVRLTYTSLETRKPETVEKTIYARDFSKLWTRATRRHRLAALGAVWGESLKSTAPATEVVRRAEELATQEPADTRARELATAATASSRLSNSF